MLDGSGELVESVPTIYQTKIVPFLEDMFDRMEMSANMAGISIAGQIENAFQELTQNMGKYVSEFSVKAVKWISTGISGISGFFVKIVIMVVSTFFIAVDYEKIFDFIKSHIPKEKEASCYSYLHSQS